MKFRKILFTKLHAILLLLICTFPITSSLLPVKMSVPNIASDAVLVQSVQMPKDSIKIEGYDFNKVRSPDLKYVCSIFQISKRPLSLTVDNRV